MIKEWNLLRVVACLTIVFLHSSTQIGRTIGYDQIENYHIVRVMLTYATPTFIVLSVIILANRYNDKLPDNFFSKRLKFIFGPFIAFAIIDTFVVQYMISTPIDIYSKLIRNLLGGYEGYFILVIFQFYVLHYIVVKYKISVEKLLPVSIVIMVLYLMFINSDHPFVNEYRTYVKLPFLAWFAYFTTGFLIGKYYGFIAGFLKRHKWLTIVVLLFVMYFITLSFNSGITQVDSRRIDIFPLSLAVTFVVLAWGQIIPNNKLINLISNYSLGIYLLHWQVQRLLVLHFNDSIINSSLTPTAKILILFVISLVISMLIIKLVSLLPFGKYIVGNTKRNFKKKPQKALQ